MQVQGKVRATISVPADADEAEILKEALAVENVRRHVDDREPRRIIYVPGRLLNIVL